MKCVRELFKEEHPNSKHLFPLTSELTTFTNLHFDCNNRGVTFSELDSFLLSQETFDDFIPELILPPYFEPFKESTPIKKEKGVEMSCHNWMEPLTVDIVSESSSFATSKRNLDNRITPSKCLLKTAPKNYHNRKFPNKRRQAKTPKKAAKKSTQNKVARDYSYVPRRIARRKRTIFNALQMAYLEERFAVSRYMGSREAGRHAQYLGIPTDTLLVWFQNRRARQRKKEMVQQHISNSTTSNNPPNSKSDSAPRQSDLPPGS